MISLYGEYPSGTIVPHHLGLAYWHPYRDTGIFYLIPFNWLVAYARMVWFFIKRGPTLEQTWYMKGYGEGHTQGYARGHFQGQLDHQRDLMERLDRAKAFGFTAE